MAETQQLTEYEAMAVAGAQQLTDQELADALQECTSHGGAIPFGDALIEDLRELAAVALVIARRLEARG